jgi:hypothetical protein
MPDLVRQFGRSPLLPSGPHQRSLEPAPRGAVLPLSALLRGRSRDVSVRVAELKAELETWVATYPQDYGGLVLLGELNVRIGLNGAARELLYRASLLEPPSWEAMQRTSLLLRRAEAEQAHEVLRVAGAPPPRWLRHAFGWIVECARTRRIPGRASGEGVTGL